MKAEILPRAETDIIRQFRYYLVDQDSATAAIAFREAVVKSVERLIRYPRLGMPLPGRIPHLRSWPVKGFEMIRIYYVEAPGRLRIIRILHGKRNVRQILQQESGADRA